MSTPVPPVALAPGQRIAWLSSTQGLAGPSQSGAINGYADWNTSSGDAAQTHSGSVGNYTWGTKWYGYQVPALPAGAVIQAVYPVVIASSTDTGGSGFYYIDYCPAGLTTLRNGGDWNGNGTGTVEFPSVPAHYIPSQQFNGSDIGQASISTVGIGIAISGSLNVGDVNWVLSASYVGLAVYYSVPNRPKNQVWVSVGNTQPR